MVRLHDLVDMVARSTMPVLVLGETGVGKEILSLAVHRRSPRADKPLVRVNCAALPESLLESELFGFEMGAFTGATQSKPGLIESADGGSFLLDEIGEMPLTTQAKLLRVLESNQVTRLGSLKPRTIDVRFIAATNRQLTSLMASGEFRRDLFYRLNGITLPIPPLRERTEEIPGLVRRFIAMASETMRRRPPSVSTGAINLLREYPWPGNIRQLKNVVDRAIAVCVGEEITTAHIVLDDVPCIEFAVAAPSLPPPDRPTPTRGMMRVDPEEDRRKILAALEQAGGNQGRAAEILGVSRRTLMKWLDDHGVPRPRKGPRSTFGG
jgi:transcriptional regulator with PAS, ATPase and Fis domain